MWRDARPRASGAGSKPPAGVADSQSVKAAEAKARRFDAGKKIAGRKLRIAVDAGGRADGRPDAGEHSDSAEAQTIAVGARKRSPSLKHVFADGAYDCTWLIDKAAVLNFTIEAVKRRDAARGLKSTCVDGSSSEHWPR